MDPLIKKRLVNEVIVYPFLGYKGGDKVFGTPYNLNVYTTHREKAVLKPDGISFIDFTVMYADVLNNLVEPPKELDKFRINDNELNGKFKLDDGTQVQYTNLKTEDDVILPWGIRISVKTVRRYQSLTKGFELVEVLM